MMKLSRLKLSIRRYLIVLLMGLPLLLNSTVIALSDSQKKAFDGGALYANTEDRCVGTSSALSSSTKLTSGKVYVLGDSITESAKTKYIDTFSALGLSATVNASANRSIDVDGNDGDSGLQAIEKDKDIISDPSTKAIVVALGSNNGNTAANISSVVSKLKGLSDARIYWVDTIAINRADYTDNIKAANEGIYNEARNNTITPISWFKTVDPTGDPLNPTGNEKDLNGYVVDADVHVHLTAVGIDALVELVSNTVVNNASPASQTVITGVCSCSVEVSTLLNGNDNPEKAWNFFIGKGLPANSAAALLGGMWAESGINPHRMQEASGHPDAPEMPTEIVDGQEVPVSWLYGKAGYGILQWTTKDRQLGLIATAKRLGKSTGDLEVQLERVWEELEYEAKVLARLREPDISISDASNKVTIDFITPGSVIPTREGYTEEGKNSTLNKRRVFSQNMFDKYSGLSPSSTLSSSGGCGNITAPGEDTKYVDGFTIYSQLDSAWKDEPYGDSTIGLSGCAPVAMAMIITNLTGTVVSPLETTKYADQLNLYNSESKGSNGIIGPRLAEHWGLKAKPFSDTQSNERYLHNDIQTITAVLQAGGLIIAPGVGTKPFSSIGHYIVIRGVTSEGKFKIADSWFEDTAEQEWDPEQILSQVLVGGMYAITK